MIRKSMPSGFDPMAGNRFSEKIMLRQELERQSLQSGSDFAPNGGRAMSIAPILQRYLDQNVTYELIQHKPTLSSTRTAEACHISGDRMAKGIVLRRDGGYLLAVLPASHHIHLQDLRMQLDDNVDLATEDEIAQLFRDCARGAVPAVGECYGLDVIVDDSIDTQPDVYLEGGDHVTLIHVDRGQFARLNAEARHGRFSAHD
jgi:Ala-tRNA(Pro) deacylase